MSVANGSGSHARQALAGLARYRPLVDDWAAFEAALERPLPVCLWANPVRVSPSHLETLLAEDGVEAVALPARGGAYRVAPVERLGHRWWYVAGLAHAQEEASLMPVTLLDPRPGERVLDLCAAPGGKTAQIATAMANTGTVVANDVRIERLRALRSNAERLGLTNVTTIHYNGANLPPDAGGFDRVLVDAPCSGEGTLRKHAQRGEAIDRSAALRYQGQQQALLRKAVQLCGPGGRIVYSTCTFAPEENEAVVDTVLRESAHTGLRLLPARPDPLVARPGVTHWEGRRFDPTLERTARLWPHDNDTGGFFIAVLEKGPAADERTHVPPDTLEPAPEVLWRDDLDARFGFDPAAWTPYLVHQRSRRGLYLVARDHAPPARPRPDVTGLFFYKRRTVPPKLTTAAAMVLGPAAQRNVIDLDRGQTHAYLHREPLSITPAQAARCTGDGHVLVRHRGFTLGVGYYRTATGRMASLFPKRWTGPDPSSGV